jgi:hypothetical protein
MVNAAQSEIRLATLFIVLVVFVPNSGLYQSQGRGAQTDSGARQAATVQKK